MYVDMERIPPFEGSDTRPLFRGRASLHLASRVFYPRIILVFGTMRARSARANRGDEGRRFANYFQYREPMPRDSRASCSNGRRSRAIAVQRSRRGTSGPAMMDNERACRLSRNDVISGVKSRGHAPFVSFYREKPAGRRNPPRQHARPSRRLRAGFAR